MNNEMFTSFPEIAMKKCIRRIFEIPSSSREVVRRIDVYLQECLQNLAAFFILSSIYNPKDNQPELVISTYLQFASDLLSKLLSPLTLQSLLQSLLHINSILQSVIILFNSSENEFSIFSQEVPSYGNTWRESIQSTIFSHLQQWIETEFEIISQSSKTFINQIHSISELAETKREVKKVSQSIRLIFLCVVL